jgi:hydroxymethylpyrimidine/phosphomethylpyrimidine kinase
MSQAPPVVLTIAGFDPSSGAGISADIKTIAAHRCYGVACITALTIQSTQGVRRVETAAPPTVRETLQELDRDLEIRAVHIGMLGRGAVAEVVAEFLRSTKAPNVVLDPIVCASSGALLLDQTGISALRGLLPLITVVTPNLDEARVLTGIEICNEDSMRAAAAALHALGARHVVVTGGHLEEEAMDLLSTTEHTETFRARKLVSRSTHGTGCAFSTAIACNLALGQSLREAVIAAKQYVTQAIEAAYPLGEGIGPVNHFYKWWGTK